MPQQVGQAGGEFTFPAPTGGLNRRDSVADMQPEFALRLINLYPDMGFVRTRHGSRLHTRVSVEDATISDFGSPALSANPEQTSVAGGDPFEVIMLAWVFDPERQPLSFSLRDRAPEWCAVDPGGILRGTAPILAENQAELFEIPVRVIDSTGNQLDFLVPILVHPSRTLVPERTAAASARPDKYGALATVTVIPPTDGSDFFVVDGRIGTGRYLRLGRARAGALINSNEEVKPVASQFFLPGSDWALRIRSDPNPSDLGAVRSFYTFFPLVDQIPIIVSGGPNVAAPTNLTHTVTASDNVDQLTLDWDERPPEAANQGSLVEMRGSEADAWSVIAVLDPGIRTWEGLLPGDQWRVRVSYILERQMLVADPDIIGTVIISAPTEEVEVRATNAPMFLVPINSYGERFPNPLASTVIYRWPGQIGADEHQVQVSQDGGATSVEHEVKDGATAIALEAPDAGWTARVRAKATQRTIASEWSEWVDLPDQRYPVVLVPGSVTIEREEGGHGPAVTISWDESEGVTTYKYQVRRDFGEWAAVAETTELEITLQLPEAEGVGGWQFRFAAEFGIEEKRETNPLPSGAVSIPRQIPIALVSQVAAARIPDTADATVRLSWDAVEHAADYEVRFIIDGTTTPSVLPPANEGDLFREFEASAGGNILIRAIAEEDWIDGPWEAVRISAPTTSQLTPVQIPSASATRAAQGRSPVVQVRWAAAAGVGQYAYQTRRGTGAWSVAEKTADTSVDLTLSEASGSGAYQFRFAAGFDVLGGYAAPASDGPSLTLSSQQKLAAPNHFTAFRHPDTEDATVNLTWSAAEDATGYKVEEEVSGSRAALADESATLLRTVERDEAATYYVKALGAEGWIESDYAISAVAAKVIPNVPIVLPSLSAVRGSGGRSPTVVVSWTETTGIATYRYQTRRGTAAWGAVQSTTGNSVSVPASEQSGTGSYQFRLAANQGVDSGYETNADAGEPITLPDQQALATPSGLSAERVPNNLDATVDISWDSVDDATGYDVDVQPTGGSRSRLTDTGATTTRTVEQSQGIRIWVRATGATGWIDSNYARLDLAAAATPASRIVIPSCLLYTSPSPRDRQKSRMPSSA